MNNELLEALNVLEEEKNISKDTLLEAIENSLVTACKNHFGKSDNIKVNIDPETCEFHVYQEKTVVEEVEDPCLEISLANAKMIDSRYDLGDTVNIEVDPKNSDVLRHRMRRTSSYRRSVRKREKCCLTNITAKSAM